MPNVKNARSSAPKPELQASELLLIRACLVVALGISVFLAWNSLRGGGVPGCGPESGCDKVLNSRWAYLLGLPISIFAAPVYLALLALVRAREVKWNFVTPLAFVVIASALWFAGLQAFVLRAFCKFCMTAHVAGVLASLLLLRNSKLSFRPFAGSFGLAAAAACAVALAQVYGPERGPKQMKIATTAPVAPQAAPVGPGMALPSSNTTTTAIPSAPAVVSTIPVSHTFSIIEGAFTLDLTKLPVTGPIDAPKKVAKLFDYTCHHCRDLHHLLSDFHARHSNELAVVSLPLPLDSNCNRVVKVTPAAHANACEYAKLGLAVFHANPAKFEDYTDWIYKPERPPELSQAREYAASLVGAAKLDQELQNPVIAAQIAMDVNIYVEAYKRSHSGQLPQLYFSESASIGAIETREQLEKIMAENLGFPRSAP